MDLALVRFLALHLTPAITATARPAVTFAVVQSIAALLVWNGEATIPDGLAWLVSPAAVLFGLVFAALETLARHDPDFEELLADVHLDKVVGAFGALAAPLLFATMGLPETDALALGTGPAAAASDPIGAALATAVAADRPPAVTAAAVGGAIGINAALTWARSEILEFLHTFELSKVWLRLETGGVVVVLALLPLMPVLMVVLVALFSMVLGGVAWTVRETRRVLDQRARVSCGHCGHRVRPEASLCPSCGEAIEPTWILDQPGVLARGWTAAFDALRVRGQATSLRGSVR
ncbi:MAG TPA: hypothetical protein DFR83_17545 [Deltaproteobacteria bacterium]|nr:hypothetical protein [Deltaproteobacteria bacterium]